MNLAFEHLGRLCYAHNAIKDDVDTAAIRINSARSSHISEKFPEQKSEPKPPQNGREKRFSRLTAAILCQAIGSKLPVTRYGRVLSSCCKDSKSSPTPGSTTSPSLDLSCCLHNMIPYLVSAGEAEPTHRRLRCRPRKTITLSK